jgi:uncharacterized membrane protein
MKTFRDKDLQVLIGNLLRIGVVIAMTIVVIGLILYLFGHGRETAHYETFTNDGVFRFHKFLADLSAGSSSAIIELGVMVLIATPIARVLFTMIGFWLEKDRLYTFIALVVLCIIVISMLMGATH